MKTQEADWLAVEVHLVNMIDLWLQLMDVFDRVLMKVGFYCNLSFDPKSTFSDCWCFCSPKICSIKVSIIRRVFTFGFYPSLHWPKRFKFFIHNALDLWESKCGVCWLKHNYLWFTFPTMHKPQNWEFPPQFWQMVNLVCLIPFAGFANGRLGNLTRLDNFGTLRTCFLLERHASPSARAPCSPSCSCLFNFHKKGSRYCFTALYSTPYMLHPCEPCLARVANYVYNQLPSVKCRRHYLHAKGSHNNKCLTFTTFTLFTGGGGRCSIFRMYTNGTFCDF